MALFDQNSPGILGKVGGWMTPERGMALSAIGQGLSQMSMGQPADLSNAMMALQDRQQKAQMRDALEGSGVMSRFTPEQRALLASMPPSAAMQIISGQVFREPEAVKPMEVNGQLVDPTTGKVIGDYRDAPTPEAPIVREVTLEDGSEALVQWNPQTQQWDAAKVPEGGTGAQPKDTLTESQARITLFQRLQDETAPVLSQIESAYNPANIADAAARATPIAGNFLQTTEGQVYSAAASQWAEGALRIATGAAAQPSEVERMKKTYFAQPGDGPATVKFKSDLRDSYTRAIRAALGERNIDGTLSVPDWEDFAKDHVQETTLPTVGAVDGGYRFLGGDPSSPDSWEKVE